MRRGALTESKMKNVETATCVSATSVLSHVSQALKLNMETYLQPTKNRPLDRLLDNVSW